MADMIFNDDIFCMYAQIYFCSSLVSILWPNKGIEPCTHQLLFACISLVHDVTITAIDVTSAWYIAAAALIAQFCIPGRSVASCVKLTKVKLMRGRNALTRALEMVKHYCCAFNRTNSTEKQKMLKNIKNWQMLDFLHSFRTMQTSIILR